MQNCLLFLQGLCRNIQLEPAEIQNAKNSTAFLKRDESIKNKKFLFNLSDIIFFSESKGYLVKRFSKRPSVSLLFTFII